jgi:toluene monooxygenase electron transfer component
MKIEVIGAGETRQAFESQAGDPILYSGLEQGIDLPYECATGTCGSCKVKRISGQFQCTWPESPGRKHLKSDDEFLMCQCVAVSDLQIEVRSKLKEPKQIESRPKWLSGVTIASAVVAPDVITISLRLDEAIHFLPGQFMVLEFEGIRGGRAWSMTNSAKTTDLVDFVIKKKPGGLLSDFLFAKSSLLGLKVKAFGPIGKATYTSDFQRNLICIAGGTGIAGMMSILDEYISGGAYQKYNAEVFFGVRTARDLFFASEFSHLVEQANGALKVVVAFSEEAATPEFMQLHPKLNFDQGFVHEVAWRQIEGQVKPHTAAYLAGPPPLVDGALRILLLKARIPAAEIFYDKFG